MTSVAKAETWYTGEYVVLPDRDELSSTRLRRGEILRHRSGLTILCCPACGSMGYTPAKVVGNDAQPSLDRTTTCGCGRCRARYTIQKGMAVRKEER